MSYWLLFLLLTGSSFGFDSPQHQIRRSLGQLSEPAHGGAESLPSFHAISIEPCLPTGSPTTLSPSGLSTHNPSPTHRNSNEPVATDNSNRTTESRRKNTETKLWRHKYSRRRESTWTNWIECAVCMEEFDIRALEDEKLVPDQAPLRKLRACPHTFHRECIDTWLRDPAKTCPHCRTPSTDDDIIRVKPSPDFTSTDIEERYTGLFESRPSESLCFRASVAIFSVLMWGAIAYGMICASHWHPDKRKQKNFGPVNLGFETGHGPDPGAQPPCQTDMLRLTGSSFGFDSPQHQIRPSLGQLSEPAHGGAESLPSFHAITIEPCLPTGSPPTLSLPESGSPTHIPEPVHHDSNEPGAAELQTIVTERPKAEAQIRRPSSEGTSTRVVDNPRGPNWIECAVCLEEFDITALEDPNWFLIKPLTEASCLPSHLPSRMHR
ncbi:hypothetical protein H4Q26_007188 [Puccinia striiformis f. sp. tritici PST-130]|nr:hypothetical protein H4Q26_007188 [Puccinia striiformis f. sp. tritici PST-130]